MSQQKKSREDKVVTLPHEDALSEIRPRVRFKRALFSFFVIVAILSVVYVATPLSRLGVIYFDGLNTLTRSELISLIGIDEDELFLSIRLSEVRANVEEHPVVRSVNVSRAWINRIRIEVIEYEVAACALVDGEMFHILTDGMLLYETDGIRANCDEMMIYGLTRNEIMQNEGETSVTSLFVQQLMRVDQEIRDLIQMIEHAPLYGDIHRFSLSLIDGNMVKVTTHTMAEQLNSHRNALVYLDSRSTGTLHLDVGGTFIPHE